MMLARSLWATTAAALLLVTGCGEEPTAEDLLTLVDLVPANGLVLAAGDTAQVSAAAQVTFRDWYTASTIFELRASSQIDVTALTVLLSGDREARANAWEQVMAASVSAGFGDVSMVGYPTLIREPEVTFDVSVPDTVDDLPVSSLFLVAYLADVEEVEEGDTEILIIDPLGAEHGILNDVNVLTLGAPAP